MARIYAQILPAVPDKVFWVGEYDEVPNFHADAGTFIDITDLDPQPKETWDHDNGAFLSPMQKWAVYNGSNVVTSIEDHREIDAEAIIAGGQGMCFITEVDPEPEVGWTYDPSSMMCSPPE